MEIATALILLLITILAYIGWMGQRDPRLPPGPIPLPILGNSLVLLPKDKLTLYQKLRESYGDMVALTFGSTMCVVFSGYDLIREVFVKRGDASSSRPPESFFIKSIQKGYGIGGSSGSLWKEHRTFFLNFLRKSFRYDRLEPLIQNEVDLFINRISKTNEKPMALRRIIGTSVANITLTLAISKRFQHDDPRLVKLLKAIDEIMLYSGFSEILCFFPSLKYLPGDLFHAGIMLRDKEEVFQWLRKFLEEREHDRCDSEEDVKDFIDAYHLQARNRESTFTEHQLLHILFEFFVAGVETTSATVRWAVLFLIHNENVQNKMAQEIEMKIGFERPPTMADRPNLPYCQAFISEVQRFGNVAPLSGPHCADKDFYVKGHLIPKGSTLLMNLTSALRDPQFFRDPNQFMPERFLDSNGKYHKNNCLIPFSIGRRLCPGESLAKTELFLFITSMVQKFIFEAEDPTSLPKIEGFDGISHGPIDFKFIARRRYKIEE